LLKDTGHGVLLLWKLLLAYLLPKQFEGNLHMQKERAKVGRGLNSKVAVANREKRRSHINRQIQTTRHHFSLKIDSININNRMLSPKIY
jgi:hypothetical protein